MISKQQKQRINKNDLSVAAPYKLMMLSGGSLVGQNILSALDDRRDQFHLSALNSKDDEPAIFEYDSAYIAPPIASDSAAFNQRFHQVLNEVEPDILIPCRDEDVAFLSALTELDPSLRSRFLCGNLAIAQAMLDKKLSWQFSQTHDLPFVPTICCDSSLNSMKEFLELHGLPLIAKPRQGFASMGVRLLVKANQLSTYHGRSNYILQKYLSTSTNSDTYLKQIAKEGLPLFHSFEETKISIQGCIGPTGRVGGVFVTDNIMHHGRSVRVERHDNSKTFELASRWVDSFAGAGWRGPVNIQCQRDQNGNLNIYEYNGRFTGATSARVLLGFDEVGITLSMWLNNDFSKLSPIKNQKTVIRTPVSRLIDQRKTHQIRQYGYWKSSLI